MTFCACSVGRQAVSHCRSPQTKDPVKVPVSWLKDYVDFDDTVEGLCDKLTFSGIEVEAVDTVGGTFDGMVVGRVTAVDRHPNADRLTLCTVDTGTGESRVVCGAPNVAVGGTYPFAPIGVTLPNGVKLKKAKIRGEGSEGMLCAEDELGLSDSHEGLMVLDAALEPGTPLSQVLGPPETVLDLEITPNRPDCLSLIGVARELAALYGTTLKIPKTDGAEQGAPVGEQTAIEVDDTTACPRYTARVLQDISIGPAPDWMQKRLSLAGIRPINNVVDVTNYVMLESGHPLHAFDKTLLDEERIVVRLPQPGESIQTLDEEKREVEPDMLVIADASRAVAVAGVMGGAGSEIRDNTTTVLLESACFDASHIRSTSKRLGLTTESSYRFERGVDIAGVEWASRRAADLMAKHAGASVSRGVIDVYPHPPEPRTLSCRFKKVQSLIGVAIDPAEIRAILASLGLEVTDRGEDACSVRIPLFRRDLEREVDLIEEVARIYGLDRIPSPDPRAELIMGADDRAVRRVRALRECLVGLGLREIMNYSTVSPEQLDRFGVDDRAARVVLPYPLSHDQSVLRTSLLPQMVETLGRNAARQIREASLFELGRTYFQDPDGATTEETRLAIGLFGPVGHGRMHKRDRLSDADMFLWLKGLWEHLAASQGFDDGRLTPVSRPCFREGFGAELGDGDAPVGWMGVVAPDLAEGWRMTDPAGILEVRVSPLIAGRDGRISAVPIVPYPAVTRDVALIVDDSVANQDILRIVETAAPKELESFDLFDIFSGEGISDGKKSVAYTFTYRAADRTLTDEEANGLHDGIKAALQDGLQAEFRDG